jgi:hypothetical protein
MLASRIDGIHRVRAVRLGFRPSEATVNLTAGDTAEITVTRPTSPVQLPVIAVKDRRQCVDGRFIAGDALELWVQARVTLEEARAVQVRPRYHVRIRDYVVERDAVTLQSRHRRESERSGLATQPYVSPSPESLATHGYVRDSGSTRWYYGPDVATLLSSTFVESHCFHAVADANRQDIVGLAFEPRARATRTDVKGTLWMDRGSGALIRVEYTYDPLDAELQRAQVGGVLQFRSAPSGGWVVAEWRIRAPVMSSNTRGRLDVTSGRVRATGQAGVVSHFVDEGGEVLELRPARTTDGAPLGASDLPPSRIPVESRTCEPDAVASIGGTIVDPVARVSTVRATWREWRYTEQGLTWQQNQVLAPVDARGSFVLCGLPLARPVRVDGANGTPSVRVVTVPGLTTVALGAGRASPQGDTPSTSLSGVVEAAGEYPQEPVPINDSSIVEGQWRSGFEERRTRGGGSFRVRSELGRTRWPSTSRLLAAIPDLDERQVGPPYNDYLVVSAMGRARADETCPVTFFINGTRMSGGRAQLFVNTTLKPGDIEAIEAYPDPTFVPAAFANPPSRCGVVALWTQPTIGNRSQ